MALKVRMWLGLGIGQGWCLGWGWDGMRAGVSDESGVGDRTEFRYGDGVGIEMSLGGGGGAGI